MNGPLETARIAVSVFASSSGAKFVTPFGLLQLR